MPPLEMSLKSVNALPPYPIKSGADGFMSPQSCRSRNSMMFPTPRSFPQWSAGTYFSFAMPKTNEVPMPRPQRRGVIFDPDVKVYHVLHLTDYSEDEVKGTWYSKPEIRNMKYRCKIEAVNITVGDHEKEQMSMYKSEPLPLTECINATYENYGEVESTVRGLENKTAMGSLRKKRHRMQAWLAVFGEQRRQRTQGRSNPEAMADAYFEVSEPCHVAANMVAVRDARDVESMDMWESRVEIEKENRLGIFTSEGSDKVEIHDRRYQRLILEERSPSRPMIVSSAA